MTTPLDILPTDERAGKSKERALVEVCSSLMSYAQSAKAVEPTQGALDDPPPSAEPFARRYVMARDSSRNAAFASALQLAELAKLHTVSTDSCRPNAVIRNASRSQHIQPKAVRESALRHSPISHPSQASPLDSTTIERFQQGYHEALSR